MKRRGLLPVRVVSTAKLHPVPSIACRSWSACLPAAISLTLPSRRRGKPIAISSGLITGNRPAICRRTSVDLPAPFGPAMIQSCGRASRCLAKSVSRSAASSSSTNVAWSFASRVMNFISTLAVEILSNDIEIGDITGYHAVDGGPTAKNGRLVGLADPFIGSLRQ